MPVSLSKVLISFSFCDWFKGTVSRNFCFWFFSWISFPPAPEYPIRTVSNLFENLRRYSHVKVHHRYQRHRWQIWHWCQRHRRQNCRRYQRHQWQILPPVWLVLLIPVANLPPVSTTPVAICHRYKRYQRQIMGTISGCWDLKVNLKAKMFL